MRVLAVLLLAALAAAEDLVVRVAVGVEPLAGASVKVLEKDDGIVFDSLNWAPDAQTDAAGQAVVQGTGGWVLVYMPGYALATARAEGQILDIALEPERIFAGRLIDSKGDAVPGADIYLRTTFKRPATFHARSDGKGKFYVYGLWFDNYELRVESAGFTTLSRDNVTEEDSGETLTIERTAAVTGTVRDEKGKPLAGVPVSVRDARTKSGADGTFKMEGLAAAYSAVRIDFPWSGSPRTMWLRPGEVRKGVHLLAAGPAMLKLRVVDPEQEPLAGVIVRASREESKRTDAKGRVALAVSAGRGGTVHLQLKDIGTHTRFPPVAPGEVHDLGDMIVRPPPEYEVRVRLPDGTIPKKGSVAGVPLADGVVRITGASRRECAVVVPGFPSVTVEAGPPGPVEVTMPEPRWIRGIVVDEYGAPVIGASVEGDGIKTSSDAEGRFRVGPFVTKHISVHATTTAAASRTATIMPGEGELELVVRGRKADLLKGRVLRGVRPVTRFRIEGAEFVDEEGRFELLVHRAEKSWVTVVAGDRTFDFALPPEGQPLDARLPDGAANVTPEGAARGLVVALKGAGVQVEAATGDDGIARFEDLAPGDYVADADGFEPETFAVGDGIPTPVKLRAVAQGTLRVWLPPGRVREWQLDAGTHLGLISQSAAYSVELLAVRIRAGEETFIDFAPAGGGSLELRGGEAGGWMELILVRPDARLGYWAKFGADGTFRFPKLPSGVYEVSAPETRTVEVNAGTSVEVDVSRAPRVVEGRVVMKSGKAAQGALVWLGGFHAITDLKGRFRFKNAREGEHNCVAEVAGYVSSVAVVDVEGDSVIAEGFPLRLTPSDGAFVQLRGRTGEPLPGADVWIDGRPRRTDALGRLVLHHVPALIDLDLPGYASLRDVEVRGGEEIKLQRGATLVVLADDVSRVVVRIDGEEWRRAGRTLPPDDPPGRLRLVDLPPGPVEVELLPANEAEEEEEESGEEEEPRIEEATLQSGGETVVDLRDG